MSSAAAAIALLVHILRFCLSVCVCVCVLRHFNPPYAAVSLSPIHEDRLMYPEIDVCSRKSIIFRSKAGI
jgi:hypothetical protein